MKPIYYYAACFCFLVLLQLPVLTVRAQNTKAIVTGSVTDALGRKLVGVNVKPKGNTGLETRTDENGRFVLEVDQNAILVFSFVGFVPQEVNLAESGQTLTIVMTEASSDLDEVVVTAFSQKQRKEAVVGSVTSIEPGKLKIPASNLTNAMAGQIAGVIGFQRSGQPGQDNSQFFIRGVTTFGYRQEPLILIDNVELSTNDLARLNVDDIASFVILKDASATALYGARGANGVILVSTKEGTEGKAKISFRSEFSSSESAKTIELSDPIEYMHLYNEASLTRTPALPLPFSPSKIRNTQATLDGAAGSNPYVYPAVDWLDMLFKKRAITHRNNLSLNGGGAVARYYIAGTYNKDNGVLKTDIRNNNENNVNFQNYQLRSNVNVNITKTTEVIVRLSGNFNEYRGPITVDGSFASDLYNVAVHTSPVLFPAYYEPDEANRNAQHILFGNNGQAGGTSSNSILYNNPYAQLLRGQKSSTESRMSAQFEVNQDFSFITEGLKFKALFNTNRRSYFDSQLAYSPFYYNINTYDELTDQYSLLWLNPQPTGYNVATEYLNYSRSEPNANSFIYLQTAADYNRTFGPHTLSSTLIGTMQSTVYSSASDLHNSLPYRNMGLAGRLTYSFKNRYFTEFNFGYNGSERFAKEHRYGFFPTIGASWVASNEDFWNKDGWFTKLKIRGSHGLVGNDAIGSQRFFYLSNVDLSGGGNWSQFGFNNQYERKGVTIRSYANDNISWETSRQSNLAAEATLFGNMNIVAEVYKNHRYDILRERYIPSSEGLESAISTNLGIVDSKGMDLSIDYSKNFSSGLWASFRGNFTYATNQYTYVEEPNYAEPWRQFIGQPISRNYGYIAERLFVDDEEARNSPTQIMSVQDGWDNVIQGILPQGGDIKYRDMNGDGRVDNLDMVFMGYPTTPEVVYGFGFSTGYKGFDLSAFFQGQTRVSFFIDPWRVSPFVQSPQQYIYGNTQVLKEFADSHWSEENQDLYAQYPRLGVNAAQIANNLQTSSWWMRDGSFIRLKSLEIGYALPVNVAQRLKMTNCRIYFNGLNLLTFSSFKLWDPEQGGNGFAYPIQRVFNVGLNINL
ncbi:TonB-dependent receptor [Sphingobacterium alkalisoli]|uniref:TonB-dependent receptor n=1 Tax=Sphingobacterium alkalisoli TaxID=1874115 RepID=A0A4U0GYZ2_9SPHI|nr:TonB-dependent receptor [Sphingobacterium alkalisoli]TJY63944.1 TonB-dependent receptor [Sphingobacterium alkalisoli]GGH23893.1 SusC/RagA family TonB-linked outer membrane protein [Sphingobacterium alkalisoli]